MTSPKPLLVVYDDSLHNRWSVTAAGGAAYRFDAPRENALPCSRALRLLLNSSRQGMVLRADEPIVTAAGTELAPTASRLLLSLSFQLAPLAPGCDDDETGRLRGAGVCQSAVCVGVRQRGTSDADTTWWPLCGGAPGTVRLPLAIGGPPILDKSHRQSRRRLHNHVESPLAETKASTLPSGAVAHSAAHALSPWWLLHLPLRGLVGPSHGIDEIVFTTGDVLRSWHSWPLRLMLDDIAFVQSTPELLNQF